jgi:hypothetical protein
LASSRRRSAPASSRNHESKEADVAITALQPTVFGRGGPPGRSAGGDQRRRRRCRHAWARGLGGTAVLGTARATVHWQRQPNSARLASIASGPYPTEPAGDRRDRLDHARGPDRPEAAAQLDELHALGDERARDLDAFLRAGHAYRDHGERRRRHLDAMPPRIELRAGDDEPELRERHAAKPGSGNRGAQRSARARGAVAGLGCRAREEETT